ncbi:MAG: type II toxin-antitoxin system VapB family antitoxin [Micrococcales bacterium]|nr:type II toxin-antitoxin system VapB family antitoxin [Micrococcales bacterium]
MRTTVSIDDSLLAAAKQRAQQRQTTLGACIEDALRLLLTEPAPSSSHPVTLPTMGGRGFRPGIDPTSNRSMLDALDDEAAR